MLNGLRLNPKVLPLSSSVSRTQIFSDGTVTMRTMRHIVADRMLDLGMVDIHANARFNRPFPNNVEYPKRVEVTAQLGQRDGFANAWDRRPVAQYGWSAIQAEIECEHLS